jgi:ElaB/YqjD/DUF883 family membrane-anchored ribosome-binding protein
MSTANDLPTSTDELKSQAQDAVKRVSEHLTDQANAWRDTATSVRYNSEEFIQNNPWPSIALAVGFGFLLGVVIARR